MIVHLLPVVLLAAGQLGTGTAAQRAVDPRAEINSLMFVHAVWRHGDRTPSVLIPTDTHNNMWALFSL